MRFIKLNWLVLKKRMRLFRCMVRRNSTLRALSLTWKLEKFIVLPVKTNINSLTFMASQLYFYFILFLIFLEILFMRDTHTMIERERERERDRQREKQAPCREPDVGLHRGSPGSHPGPKAGTKPLNHPGIPNSIFKNILLVKLVCSILKFLFIMNDWNAWRQVETCDFSCYWP